MTQPIKLVIDTDPGVDDAIAILMALAVPEVEVVGITSIGGNAFHDCKALTELTFPGNLASIGGGAFRECSGLTNLTIPESVKTIADHAFAGCAGLTQVRLGNRVTSIGSYAFSGCRQLKELAIPETVTTLGAGAFASCESLEEVAIPAGLKHAISTSHTSSEGATLSQFFGCSALTSVEIGVLTVNQGFTGWIDNDLLKTCLGEHV